MTNSEYQQAVKRTMAQLDKQSNLSMLCMGLAGETGEVVDHVKNIYIKVMR